MSAEMKSYDLQVHTQGQHEQDRRAYDDAVPAKEAESVSGEKLNERAHGKDGDDEGHHITQDQRCPFMAAETVAISIELI